MVGVLREVSKKTYERPEQGRPWICAWNACSAPVHVLFVHLWNAHEKIYLRKNAPDPGYGPDPQSRVDAQRVATAGQGKVTGEDAASLASEAKAFLGSGPETKLREQRTRVSLGPYVALAALLPLSFVLLRRNL